MPDWRSGRLWRTVGYMASAAWMLLVLAVTNGDVQHPFFNTIFIVPLVGWVVGLVVARVIARLQQRPRNDR